MTIEMPHALQEAFGWLGLEWPQADEDKLFAAGDAWRSYAEQLRTVRSDATKSASAVWSDSTGAAADAFHGWWTGSPDEHLAGDADGAEAIGAALTAFGAVTVALKGAYIAQLAILAAEIAQAVATAFISFGATLAEIPAFAAATRVIVKQAIEKAIKQGVQSEVKHLFDQAEALFKKAAKRELDTAEAAARPFLRRSARHQADVLRKNRKETDAGLSFFGPKDKTGDIAPSVIPDPQRFTLDLHGTPHEVMVSDEHGAYYSFTPKELADFVKNDPAYQASANKEIRLMACETGQDPAGFAQQFATEMGQRVHAPTELGWSDSTGNVWSATQDATGNSTWPPDGVFTTFHP